MNGLEKHYDSNTIDGSLVSQTKSHKIPNPKASPKFQKKSRIEPNMSLNFEIMNENLKQHFSIHDLDIRKRKPGYSRFIDQKVTPDVLSFIADCILNFIGEKKQSTSFVIADIWRFPYFVKNTIAVFGKPSPENETTGSEYDKFIAQPLKTLAFSKVLKEKKVGRRNIYMVSKPDILEDISQNERNAWYFLVAYIEKLLADSGFIQKFEEFRSKAKADDITAEDFEKLKTEFQSFMRGYTEINGNTEINRIFPKILNPYAAFYQIPGTEKGHITPGRFIYSDLMYNRENFRDIGKDKTLSRQEALKEITKQSQVFLYRVQKAKNIIKRHHSSSEVKDSLGTGTATQVHHIFPEHQFPEISDYLENLILLTPQQHNIRAHPVNKTRTIDPDYQKECLISKIDSIISATSRGQSLYSKESFIHVINVGYHYDLSTNTSFDKLKEVIQKH